MIRKLIVFVVIINVVLTMQARNFTVSGHIVSEQSGETLIAASVFENGSRKGVLSNSFGFYSLTLPEGHIELMYSCIGYSPVTLNFELNGDTTLNIRLQEDNMMEQITVVGNRVETVAKSTQMSAINVPVAQIKTVPALLGEVDLIKALQLLPGVQSGTEGFTGFYVRGGGPDENLFLLDGVPVYNINHMAGFFSVFNADAIKNVTLYKGSFPARFGGRLSSVLDIRMNDGNNRKLSGTASVGLISSRVNLEGPLFNENTTFNISARRTYFDILMQPFMQYSNSLNDEKVKAGYYFYDLNAKLSHRFSDNDRLYFSFYMGDDVIYANIDDRREAPQTINTTKMDWNWGNLLAALRWNHIIGNKLFMNTTLTYTRYRFDLGFGLIRQSKVYDPDDFNAKITYKSGIEDFAAKVDFDWSLSRNEIKFGANYTRHRFRPGVSATKVDVTETGTPIDAVIGDSDIPSDEVALYVEDNINIARMFKVNMGVHYSAFAVQNRFYHSLQPRVSARFLFNDRLSLKTGYALMNQYIHLLSNSSISLPTDLWVPVTKRIEPMNSHQISLGMFYDLNGLMDISVEAYRKTMNNLIEYKDGATFLGSSTGWEDKVCMGKGLAYGVEVLVQKTVGKTTGWIGYTLARTERLFDRPGEELNFGKIFPSKYDRRHDISIVVSHRFTKRIDASATWIYGSGTCATLGMYEFEGEPIPSSFDYDAKQQYTYVSERNNFRYPAYHRLDLSVNFHKQKRYGRRTWSVGVYNAYNRMNPFIVYSDTQEPTVYGGETRKVLKQLTLFPIIPSISYSYTF